MGIDQVQDLTPRVQYTASAGQTAFDYTFPIFDDDGVKVDKNGTLLTKTTHYTVTGVQEDNGGTITLVTPASAGDTVTLYRETPLERLTDLQQNGPFSSENFNDEYDRYLLMIQELHEGFDRVLQSPINAETPIFDADTFDPIGPWLGKYLFINNSGVLVPADGSETAQILTTNGDLLTVVGGQLARLGVGANGQVLKVVSGVPGWVDSGSGSGGGGLSLPVATAQFVQGASAGASSADVQTFTADGTWTKPANAKWVRIIVVGAGGGGGSGRKGAAASNRGGGQGGGPGGISYWEFPATALGATEAVEVGPANAGGASTVANDTDGTNGSGTAVGGKSSFHNIIAFGGTGGVRGTTTGGSGGGLGTQRAIQHGTTTGNGGNGGTGGGAAGDAGDLTLAITGAGFGNTAGGGGGGINSGNARDTSGGTGGDLSDGSATYLAGGTAPMTDGTAGNPGNTQGDGGVSTGGGGGASSLLGDAGAGGPGGGSGAGGGGGGAAVNGVGNSGAGGPGGGGLVIVTTYF